MCERHGHILSRPNPGMTPDKDLIVMQTFAEKCPDFNRPASPLKPAIPTSNIAWPDTGVMQNGSSPESTRPSSCADCKFCAPSSLVLDELSWGLPMCTARGRLLFPNFMTQIASDCQYGVEGLSSIDSLDDVILLPVYEEAFSLIEKAQSGAVTTGWVAGKQDPDPREYPTDKPLSAEDERDGLRAWRKVSDPLGYGEDMFWPVFDPEFIKQGDPLEFDKIPFAGSSTNPELYIDWQDITYKMVMLLTKMGVTPISEGGAGTGKTEQATHLAYLGNMPLRSIQLTGEMTLDDFAGSLRFMNSETLFREGAFAYAIQRLGITVLEEWNMAAEELRTLVRPIFDGRKVMSLEGTAQIHPVTGQLVIQAPIKQHDYNGVIVCMNDAHDYINTGVSELSDPDRTRHAHVRFEQPPEYIEREILVRHYMKDGHDAPSQVLLDAITQIGREIRQHISEGSLEGMTWGMRSQIMAMNATKWVPISEAYMLAGGNYFEQSKRDSIRTTVSSHTEGREVR